MIDAIGLTKRYGNVTAVDHLSFRVEPGKVTGFLGPNGAGKSTTCRLMVGLDSGAGTTTFNGVPFQAIPEPMRSVGLLLEAKAFHPTRTARNHLRMLCAANGLDDKRADECLELVGLTEVAKGKPKGFSLGMGQRLGLAAALLGDPKALVLDEPGNGLDPQGIQWLRDLLRYLASQGRAIFVSSHLLSEMEAMADHVVVIGRGKLIADEPTSQFIARGSQQWVVVRTPQAEPLLRVLAERGLGAVQDPDLSIRINTDRLDVVGDAAFSAGVTLHELSLHRSSLEQAFLELTGGANQYAGAAPAAMMGAPR
jgi:ABC-2 type transport system ATP-binding protein